MEKTKNGMVKDKMKDNVCKVYQDDEVFLKIKRGDRNATLPTYPCQIEIKEPEAITHEVGHCMGAHLDKFGIKERIGLEELEDYAGKTYVGKSPGEGFAQAFADYFERPKFLEKESKNIYNHLSDVVRKNPEIRKILRKSKKCVKKYFND